MKNLPIDKKELYIIIENFGLIDFNCSGMDVNINIFVNETNRFPEEKDFDELSLEEIIQKIDSEQDKVISAIFKHYKMNELKKGFSLISNALRTCSNIRMFALWLNGFKMKTANKNAPNLLKHLLKKHFKQPAIEPA